MMINGWRGSVPLYDGRRFDLSATKGQRICSANPLTSKEEGSRDADHYNNSDGQGFFHVGRPFLLQRK